MIRINLLPHREEKRKARRQQFYALGGMIVVLAGLIALLVHTLIGARIEDQQSKNDFLKREVATLDKQIDEIKRLKEQTDALLSRKQVIESLQANRGEIVQMFNELARQVPEGVYLGSVKQTGAKLHIVGFAQSNARVSTLMRNLGSSPLFGQPVLIEVRAAVQNNRPVNQFIVDVGLARANPEPRKAAAEGRKS
ncbi:MAG: hypothetical protein OHK0026_12970 [Rhodocyclaceae bacterium]